jgi:hypothetical protein
VPAGSTATSAVVEAKAATAWPRDVMCIVSFTQGDTEAQIPAARPARSRLQARCRVLDAIRSGTRYAKWAGGSRSQTLRRADDDPSFTMSGFTQDDGYVQGVPPMHDAPRNPFRTLPSRLFGQTPILVCVFITAGPITKLCAWGRRIVEDMCYEIRRAEACVDFLITGSSIPIPVPGQYRLSRSLE